MLRCSDKELILDQMIQYLKINPVSLSNSHGDGRVNSIDNENEVIEKLRENAQFRQIIAIPQERYWYDIALIGDGYFLPINIKVSNLLNSSADNCSSKQGMAYALTGEKNNIPLTWKEFDEFLAKHLKFGFDYYFIIVNKADTSDCYWTSLKKIKKLTPNGNNLPFQANWALNREFSGRSEKDAMKYIIEVYLESWDKKVDGDPVQLRRIIQNWSNQLTKS